MTSLCVPYDRKSGAVLPCIAWSHVQLIRGLPSVAREQCGVGEMIEGQCPAMVRINEMPQ